VPDRKRIETSIGSASRRDGPLDAGNARLMRRRLDMGCRHFDWASLDSGGSAGGRRFRMSGAAAWAALSRATGELATGGSGGAQAAATATTIDERPGNDQSGGSGGTTVTNPPNANPPSIADAGFSCFIANDRPSLAAELSLPRSAQPAGLPAAAASA